MKAFPRSIFLFLLAALLCTSLVSVHFFLKAVNLEVNPSMTSAASQKIHLVMISQEMDNPYWRQIEHGAKVAAEKNDIWLEYMGPIIADPNEQIAMIEMAIVSKIDGILTQGLNDDKFTPIINKAIEMNIPVITVDSDTPGSNRITYVGTDNYSAGLMAGKELIKLTGGKANVGIITGLFQAANLSERVRGFMDAVKDEEGIRILDMKESRIDRVGAATAAYKLAHAYPELDALVATSALDGIGYVQMRKEAIENQDPIIGADREIRVVAFDDLKETLDYMKEGYIDSTIVQQPYQMGYESVELMLEHLSGNRIVTMYNTDVSVLRKTDARSYQGGQYYDSN